VSRGGETHIRITRKVTTGLAQRSFRMILEVMDTRLPTVFQLQLLFHPVINQVPADDSSHPVSNKR